MPLPNLFTAVYGFITLGDLVACAKFCQRTVVATVSWEEANALGWNAAIAPSSVALLSEPLVCRSSGEESSGSRSLFKIEMM